MTLLPEFREKRIFARQIVRHRTSLLGGDLDDALARIQQLLGRQRTRVQQHVGRLDERLGEIDRVIGDGDQREHVAVPDVALGQRRRGRFAGSHSGDATSA